MSNKCQAEPQAEIEQDETHMLHTERQLRSGRHLAFQRTWPECDLEAERNQAFDVCRTFLQACRRTERGTRAVYMNAVLRGRLQVTHLLRDSWCTQNPRR